MASTIIEKMYTREEAAAWLGISRATFDRRRAAGLIEEVRISPHCIRFTEDALRQYLTNCTGTLESRILAAG